MTNNVESRGWKMSDKYIGKLLNLNDILEYLEVEFGVKKSELVDIKFTHGENNTHRLTAKSQDGRDYSDYFEEVDGYFVHLD